MKQTLAFVVQRVCLITKNQKNPQRLVTRDPQMITSKQESTWLWVKTGGPWLSRK